MLLVRANYLDGNFQWKTGDIEIEDGRLLRVGENLSFPEDELAVDCSGYTIIPGFVDIHIHGCAGTDTCDGTREDIDNMARFLPVSYTHLTLPTT